MFLKDPITMKFFSQLTELISSNAKLTARFLDDFAILKCFSEFEEQP